jgi:hypothetical protein
LHFCTITSRVFLFSCFLAKAFSWAFMYF